MEFNPTAERKHELINGYINGVPERPKESLCRFYLRGLCLFQPKDCRMSHGIDDLKYQKSAHNATFKEDWGSVVSPFNEKPLYRGELSYLTLYKTQPDKKHSLQEINSNKQLRYELRRALHRRQFQKFIELLKREHNKNVFREDFLEEEYYRVGFNKLMTRIKYAHLIEYLCEEDNSRFFKVKNNKQSYIIERMSHHEMMQECRGLFKQYIEEVRPERIVESQLRGWLFKNNTNIRLPPINMMLTWLKLDFGGFLAQLSSSLMEEGVLGEQAIVAKLETDESVALRHALQYIEENGYAVIEWPRITECINQKLAVNNAALAESLKGKLIDLGFQLFYLPMSVFLYNPKASKQLQTEFSCSCEHTGQQLKVDSGSLIDETLARSPSVNTFVIISRQQVHKIEEDLLHNTIVAVDVEGRLRKNATIEIVQVRCIDCVYVFDILSADAEGKLAIIRLLQQLFTNECIVKVFHDCRHDSLAIHEVLGCCIRNVLDTSGMDILQQQMGLYRQKRMPSMACVRPPGLNDLLQRYNAPNGINRLKEKFHKMMADSNSASYFLQRPIDEEYLEYCVKDVEDLLFLGLTLRQGLPPPVLHYIGVKYVGWGYLSTK